MEDGGQPTYNYCPTKPFWISDGGSLGQRYQRGAAPPQLQGQGPKAQRPVTTLTPCLIITVPTIYTHDISN
jgi:hypothetical protein